ncbi:Uncharacterized protein TCM_016662 [Theobroma cacao]|uniref:Uncharacterized protein n=1 Tax=Theobroma cacao TaxID=3641 RepID=A0A061G6W2_THECC|nr:Uncharacterized protein TCM_016662 [Theobroma cacao]
MFFTDLLGTDLSCSSLISWVEAPVLLISHTLTIPASLRQRNQHKNDDKIGKLEFLETGEIKSQSTNGCKFPSSRKDEEQFTVLAWFCLLLPFGDQIFLFISEAGESDCPHQPTEGVT